jgi:hypothetical protein
MGFQLKIKIWDFLHFFTFIILFDLEVFHAFTKTFGL